MQRGMLIFIVLIVIGSFITQIVRGSSGWDLVGYGIALALILAVAVILDRTKSDE